MTWNVLLTRPIESSGMDVLEAFADVTVLGEDETLAQLDLDQFDAIVQRRVGLSGEVIMRAPRLKVISKHGVGLDSIDVETATEQGVIVCNAPGANARAVAEHTLALLLGVRRNLRAADRDIRNGLWEKERYTASELRDQVFGVYGCGRIGRLAIEMVEGFGMDSIAFDPYVTQDELPSGVEKVDTIAALFGRADVVSIHAPLTDETRNTVSTPELRRLGERGILINCGRGAIVDERALVEALRNETIAGAGIDAFENEPPDPDDTLLDVPNAILTPHIGYKSVESRVETSRVATKNVRTVYDGGLPESTVNAQSIGKNES